MVSQLSHFRGCILNLSNNPNVSVESESAINFHPFDDRNIHPEIRKHSIKLFDDGHYSQATFEAFKYIDNRVKKASGLNITGEKLMQTAFNDANPAIALNALSNASDVDEQRGYRFIFAGCIAAIRNPRGHEVNLTETTDTCLDHLSFASLLLRRLDKAIGAVV